MIINSSVIKGKKSQNGGNKKTKLANFPKNEHFLPPDTRAYVCVSGSKKCSFFQKMCRALFSYYLRLEIRLFALLPTNYRRFNFPQKTILIYFLYLLKNL